MGYLQNCGERSVKNPNPTLKADRPTACFLLFSVFISSSPRLVWGGGLAPRYTSRPSLR